MKIQVRITTNENMKYFNCPKDTIKEIEFEEYIATVVASEMGNAPEEALKAQAIASRSYACAQNVLSGKVISDSASKAQAFRAPRISYKNC
jgi:SpoIID/LytB domain protein